MSETSDVRRRVRQMIERSRQTAVERRARTASATKDGHRVLTTVAAPVFKSVSAVLKAEGFGFTVSTPVDAVRMTADASGDRFIELTLDTASDPPALRGRVSRVRGRDIEIDDAPVCEGEAIGALTGEQVLEFLLRELPPFVER